MADIIGYEFTPTKRPPTGTGEVTITVTPTIANNTLFPQDVTWGMKVNDNLRIQETITVDPGGSLTAKTRELSHTFANTGGIFLPEGQSVQVCAAIIKEVALGGARTATITTPGSGTFYTIEFADGITDWSDLEAEELTQVHLGQNSVDGLIFGGGKDIYTGEGEITITNTGKSSDSVLNVEVSGKTISIAPGELGKFLVSSEAAGQLPGTQ